jgi:hypothetical protein
LGDSPGADAVVSEDVKVFEGAEVCGAAADGEGGEVWRLFFIDEGSVFLLIEV